VVTPWFSVSSATVGTVSELVLTASLAEAEQQQLSAFMAALFTQSWLDGGTELKSPQIPGLLRTSLWVPGRQPELNVSVEYGGVFSASVTSITVRHPTLRGTPKMFSADFRFYLTFL
jgi:hypothetical protein